MCPEAFLNYSYGSLQQSADCADVYGDHPGRLCWIPQADSGASLSRLWCERECCNGP